MSDAVAMESHVHTIHFVSIEHECSLPINGRQEENNTTYLFVSAGRWKKVGPPAHEGLVVVDMVEHFDT